MYVDTVFEFYWFFCNCLVGCLSMINWTPAVLVDLYACVLHFCICTRSTQSSIFHMERRSRNTLIIIITIICCTVLLLILRVHVSPSFLHHRLSHDVHFSSC